MPFRPLAALWTSVMYYRVETQLGNNRKIKALLYGFAALMVQLL